VQDLRCIVQIEQPARLILRSLILRGYEQICKISLGEAAQCLGGKLIGIGIPGDRAESYLEARHAPTSWLSCRSSECAVARGGHLYHAVDTRPGCFRDVKVTAQIFALACG
jgi:hypothetical protein